MLSSWSAALPHDENVLAFQHSAREVVEIDLLGAGPHLVALLLEPGPQRRHGRGGQLPELFARFSLDAPFPALQVEVERAVEQGTDAHSRASASLTYSRPARACVSVQSSAGHAVSASR